MRIRIGEEICVQDATEELYQFCKDELIVENQDYYKRLQAGRSVFGVPKQFQLFTRIGGTLGIPFGMSDELWSRGLLKGSVDVGFSPIRAEEYVGGVDLLGFQEDAVRALYDARNGILESPCGSGKTTMGLELIKRIGGRALWITHTSELLQQSKKTAEFIYGASGMGTITAGKIDAGSRITFATVQTLSKVDLSTLSNAWDVVIVDECHRVGGTPTQITMFYNVLSKLCARYKYGLTATPFRGDGLTVCMNAMLGRLVHTVDREDVAELVCPVEIHKFPYDLYIESKYIVGNDGTLNYARLIGEVVSDTNRNEYLRQMINSYISQGKNILVLSERVAHLAELRELIGVGTIVQSGKRSSSSDSVLYATYALLSEGFDKPELEVLVLASPIKNERLVTQSCGRVARRSEGKSVGIIADMRDSMSIFIGYGKQRDRIYKKLGYVIK